MDAEVTPEAPVESATIDNSKKEIVENSNIFTKEEIEAINAGADARVWMVIDALDEETIEAEEVAKVHEPGTDIKITLTIPESMISMDNKQ